MLLGLAAVLLCATAAKGETVSEYNLKAAFLYNFALFTDWPAEVGARINLCVLGQDPFGAELDELNGEAVAKRRIAIRRTDLQQPLKGCQILYIAPSAIGSMARVLDAVRGSPVLTVADSPDAARRGVGINMVLGQSKISLEINMNALHASGLNVSSKLLRLAREVDR